MIEKPSGPGDETDSQQVRAEDGSTAMSTFSIEGNNNLQVGNDSTVTVNTVLPPEQGPVVVGQVPARPVEFVDRVELEHLVATLNTAHQVVVCAGIRGGGKSHLAAAYARRCQAQGWPVVAWVNAEHLTDMVKGLAAIARALRVSDPNGDDERSAANARDLLNSHPGRTLLVLDNATDADDVWPWLPSSERCHVVITSTSRRFTQYATLIEVEAYRPGEAVAYLAGRCPHLGEEEADEVAVELGRLPLALAQAGAVIHAEHLTAQRYLTKLADAALEVSLPAAADYPRSLAAAIELSLDAVAQPHGPAEDDSSVEPARTLLTLLAVNDLGGMSRSWLNAALAAIRPDLDSDRLVGVLVQASLVTRTSAPGDGGVVMHRLVAKVIRAKAERGGALVDVLVKCACLSGIAGGDDWATHQESSLILESSRHYSRIVHQILQLSQPALDDSNLELVLSAGQRHSTRLFGLGAVVPLVYLMDTLIDLVSGHVGPEHPRALLCRSDAAVSYRQLGRPADAVALDEVTLAIRERVLGSEHPDALLSRSNLAGGYRELGRADEAVALDEVTLSTRERVLGSEHPQTLISCQNLAMGYADQGRLVEAVALDEVTLATRERVLGLEHPDTLNSRGNLAAGYFALGRTDEGVALIEFTLATMERVLGSEHPFTLSCRNNLARGYVALGRVNEAAALDRDTLIGREKVLGPDHPDTMVSRHNLAADYKALARGTVVADD